MWISKQEFLNLAVVGREAEAKLSVALQQNAVLQANLDNARLRLNQLEKERAQLTNAVLGVKIPVPEFQPVSAAGFDIAKSLQEMPGFGDMGDELAAAEGISHAPDGSLVYGKAKTHTE